MAKAAKKLSVVESVNVELLLAISSGRITHVSKDDAMPLVTHNPPLIEVNTNMLDAQGHARVRLTPSGVSHLQEQVNVAPQVAASEPAASPYAVIDNAELPPSKRGLGLRGGAPKVYPFDELGVGQSFFVPISDKHPDPVKTLGSTVSSANMRYAKETGHTKLVDRAKRGSDRKALLDTAGNKIMERVEVPIYEYDRKFSIRGVEAGQTYGSWVAPANGALIARVK